MKQKKGFLALVLALTLVVGAGIGGTVAWLATNTGDVVNTFTYGDINIKLEESANGDGSGDMVQSRSGLKIVPGVDVAKDPQITVEAGSEACWLYVKVTEENWPTSNVSYSLVASDWEKFTPSTTTVNPGEQYYYYKGSAEIGTAIQLLTDNQIVVSHMLTKADVSSAQPKLTFTGYAIQKSVAGSAADAWNAVNTSANLSTDFAKSGFF